MSGEPRRQLADMQSRRQLADMQTRLVFALTGRADVPAGFNPGRILVAAIGLARKRRRAVAHAWPRLTRAIGAVFEEQFTRYADVFPLPSDGGALADGRAFARWLAQQDALPDAGRLEALAVDLYYVACPSGMRRRSCPAVRSALLRQPRALVLAVRLPWLGERRWRIPLSWRRVGT